MNACASRSTRRLTRRFTGFTTSRMMSGKLSKTAKNRVKNNMTGGFCQRQFIKMPAARKLCFAVSFAMYKFPFDLFLKKA